jgi:hypothetical protein
VMAASWRLSWLFDILNLSDGWSSVVRTFDRRVALTPTAFDVRDLTTGTLQRARHMRVCRLTERRIFRCWSKG